MTVSLDPATTDRAVGAVLALAIGDAMGAPYEFGPPRPSATCELEGGGGFGWAPGEWTDDTQMALAVLDVLATGDHDVGAAGSSMVRWFESRPIDVGNQTRAVLGDAVRRNVSPAEAAGRYQQRNPDAAGNGALMRTGPVALAALGDGDAVAGLAADVARLTHPHPDSVDACVLWSLAIEHAITTAVLGRAFDWRAAVCGGLDHVEPERRAEWVARIDAACGGSPIQFRGINGWVVGAFQAALAAITSTADGEHSLPCDHLATALRAAARAGGDTDTVAAIAGSLLGARWGATAIPLRWRRLLHGRRTYAEPPVRAVELDRLARLALRGGRPDGHGWPGTSHMEYGRMEPCCVELEGAWFGNAAGVADAVARGATVVISLCRMGDADVPEGVEHHTIGLVDTDVGDNPNVTQVLADTAGTVAHFADAGERVFVHCARAEHRAPALAAAYLVLRGADVETAVRRAREALGGAPQPFMRDALADVERISRLGR